MMREALFSIVFIGIESPDPDVLIATQKKQNTRRNIAASVHRIYDAGIFVVSGFIVGFDDEKGSVAQPIIELIEESSIAVCMVGLLLALPNTQLTRRLETEGRLHPDHDVQVSGGQLGDQCTAGLNFDTRRPRQKILADYREIVERAYHAESYFGRVRKVCGKLNLSPPPIALNLSRIWVNFRIFWRIARATMALNPELRRKFWSTILWCLLHNPWAVKPALLMFSMYVHLGPFARHVSGQIAGQIEALESGNTSLPTEVPVKSMMAETAQG